MNQADLFDWAKTPRAQLDTLPPGQDAYVNGVHVRRLPCTGRWYDVAVREEYPDVIYQRLRFGDALNRVRSGHVNKPPTWKRVATCRHCEQVKPDRWNGAFSFCIECVGLICIDCWNTHSERCRSAAKQQKETA